MQFVPSNRTTRSLGLQFVPSSWITRSLELDNPSLDNNRAIRGNELQSERTSCPIRENELQFKRTDCLIRGNELQSEKRVVRENELSNSRERITNPWERITYPWERIAQFDITIYLWIFFLNPHVPSGLSYYRHSFYSQFSSRRYTSHIQHDESIMDMNNKTV